MLEGSIKETIHSVKDNNTLTVFPISFQIYYGLLKFYIGILAHFLIRKANDIFAAS